MSFNGQIRVETPTIRYEFNIESQADVETALNVMREFHGAARELTVSPRKVQVSQFDGAILTKSEAEAITSGESAPHPEGPQESSGC